MVARYNEYAFATSVVPIAWGQRAQTGSMHRNTKLTPILRKEIFRKWTRAKGALSLRGLAVEYHVDKRVISRILERGRRGDFSVHDSTNERYRKSNGVVRKAAFIKQRRMAR